MIYDTADLHGKIPLFDIPAPQGGEQNYLIVNGDFGFLWLNEPNEHERTQLKLLERNGCIILFVDGNHENFFRLAQLEKVNMFGGVVGKVSDKIYHLRRGEVYTIQGKTFFTFGGAFSIDMNVRTEGVSWWREEQPNYKEYFNAIENLKKHENKVDYIITHTAPRCMLSTHDIYGGRNGFDGITKYGIYDEKIYSDNTTDLLDRIYEITDFKKWYFGHFHIQREDVFYDKRFVACYDELTKIE